MNLEEDEIARKVAMIQINNKFPGLMNECQDLLKKLNLDDIDVNECTKFAWKKNVKKAVTNDYIKDMLNKMKKYKKIDTEIKREETFETKKYLKEMNLSRARMKFSMESQMVKHFKFNYMSDLKNERSNWACNYCLEKEKKYQPDSMKHALNCPEYSSIRLEYNLDEQEDAVDFFTKIVTLRNSLYHESVANK